MSELTDYRRYVEAPLLAKYEAQLAACHAEIAELQRKLSLSNERLPSPRERQDTSGDGGDWRNRPECP